MTESVEAAKVATAGAPVARKNAAQTAEPAAPKDAARPGKAAVLAAVIPRRMPSVPFEPRMAAVATVALVVGAGFGMLAAPRGQPNDALIRIEAGLDAGRTEAARLNAEIERLGRTLTTMREATEAGRGESRSLGTSVGERLTRMEQNLDRRITALAEKSATPEHETATPPAAMSAQIEKPAAAPAAPPPLVAAAATAARTEPTQTASLADTKPKADTLEAWALRDVYGGVAMLEDRKRRLVEVAPGDAVPGIGRVESIERRGRTWVVVTRQGLITPQMW